MGGEWLVLMVSGEREAITTWALDPALYIPISAPQPNSTIRGIASSRRRQSSPPCPTPV